MSPNQIKVVAALKELAPKSGDFAPLISNLAEAMEHAHFLTEEEEQLLKAAPELLEAVQDSLVCLAGERYTGGQIFPEEPYARQKLAVRAAQLQAPASDLESTA